MKKTAGVGHDGLAAGPSLVGGGALKAEPLGKPYVSESQRRWAHTRAGKKALGGKEAVHEWDQATRGKKLPEKVTHKCIEKKLKDLKEKVSKVDFYHLRFGEEPNKLHGWISPKGDYHHLDPKTHHKEWIKGQGFKNAHEAHKAGWIEAGTGGLTEVSSHSDIIGNRSHPAVRKLREMVGKHWPGDFQLHVSDKPASLHSVDTEHFSRHGTVKPPKAYKSEKSSEAILNRLKLLKKKLKRL